MSVHPACRAEISDALKWYRSKDPRVGANLRDAISHAAEQVRLLPGTWPPYLFRTRRFLVTGFSYSFVYRENGSLIEVIALAHAKQRPGYWRERLDDEA
jgi:plasmid stabilization system protein ParE